MASQVGWHDPQIFSWAVVLWESLDFARGTGPTGLQQRGAEFEKFPWRTGLWLSPGLDVWLLRVVSEWAKALKTNADNVTVDLELLDCPYGFLAVQYVLLSGFQRQGNADMQDQISGSLVGSMEVLLDAPYHTFDFLESTAWNFSSHDIAVNLGTSVHYPSYGAYAEARPIPPPELLPWHAVVRDGHTTVFSSAALRASYRALQRRHAMRPLGGQPLSLAVLQLHDATAAELWASTQLALRTVAGVHGPASLSLVVEPRFCFTQVKALRGTETGDMLASHTVAPFEHLRELKLAAQRGEIRLADVGDEWLPREAPSLLTADLVICSEPFWLCPLVAAHREAWVVGMLHMALLNEFPYSDEDNLRAFWAQFYAMARREDVLLAVACRMTGEQVRHQAGVHVPYVPFLGLHVEARYAPGPERRALLFRNNRQHMLTFRAALRLFLAEVTPPCPVSILDLNDVPHALSFGDIAAFHAVLLLPHGPNALRLSDLYAMAMPMVVPGEPLVHKFVWASRTFAGYDAEPNYRERAPEALRAAAEGAAGPWARANAPFSPFHFLKAWSPHRCMDDKRYWYQYTEWATLPHLLRFRSLPELVERLARLTPEEARRISTRMASHHLVVVADALGWWRGALSALITHASTT